MIGIFCHDHHAVRTDSSRELCDECRQLHDYAMRRIEKCPYGEEKPTCAKCPIHCYKRDRREQVRRVMRYSGPRMLRLHPVLAVRHILDGRSNPNPVRPGENMNKKE